MVEEVVSSSPMPAEAKRMSRRRIYLIDKEIQYRFIGAWFLMTIGFVLFILGVLYFSLKIIGVSVAPHASNIARSLYIIISINALAIIVLVFGFFFYSIRESHKIAGPAYRIGLSLKRIADGDINFRVTLRKADYFKPVAKNLNELLDDITTRNTTLTDALDKLQNLHERLNTLEGVPPEMRNLSSEIIRSLDKVVYAKKVETGGEQKQQEVISS